VFSNNNHLLPIDLEAYRELKNHIAKALVPLLQIWLYATRREGVYEKRYEELCQFLNIQQYRYESLIKRTLGPSLDELKQFGYLADWQTQREIALELLRTDAPERLRLALSVIAKCPAMTAQTAQHIETLKQQAAINEFESAFVFMVGNGRQYILNGLAGAAARTFDSAADSIPNSYVVNRVLDLGQVAVARKAFSDGRFSEAADLFANAYRKVPSDVRSPSSAFRRGPAFKIGNSGNQGDTK